MNFKDYNETIGSLKKYANSCIQDMKKMLEHTDVLKDSIDYKIDISESGFILSFTMPYYATYVNDGRYPHKGPGGSTVAGWENRFPNIDAISAWAKKKLPQFRDAKGKWISDSSRAFLVSRAIAKHGIKPIPFMEIPYDRSKELAEAIGSSFASDFAVQLQHIFNDAGIGE